jgi:hypothetical protein
VPGKSDYRTFSGLVLNMSGKRVYRDLELLRCTMMPDSSGLFSACLVCVYPTIAVVAPIGTYWSEATGKLLCNTFAFRAMDIGASAKRTLLRSN